MLDLLLSQTQAYCQQQHCKKKRDLMQAKFPSSIDRSILKNKNMQDDIWFPSSTNNYIVKNNIALWKKNITHTRFPSSANSQTYCQQQHY